MKYFCPLENVKTIKGRSNNEVNGTSTNINGWEIASNGIWADGKDNNAVGKGKNNLGIFTKNWSIDSEGNVIANGNIAANNGTFKNIYALENNFFIENRSGTYNLNVIHLDNFELIKNNTLNKLTLLGKNTKEPNASQEIVIIKEDDKYFELDFKQGCIIPSLKFSNSLINEDKYPFIGTNINGYLNLNNNLTLTASSDYLFDEHSISRSNVDSNISYKYTLPDKSGEFVIAKNFQDPNIYVYNIEIKKGFRFGEYEGSDGKGSIVTFYAYNLDNDVIQQMSQIYRVNLQSSSISYSFGLSCTSYISTNENFNENASSTGHSDYQSINITYKNGILESIGETIKYTSSSGSTGYATLTTSSRTQDDWDKII